PCRARAAIARTALPGRAAVHGRHGFRLGQDLRPRGLAAGTEHLARDFVGIQLRNLPGTPHAGALPGGARQARLRAYAQRIGPGGGPRTGGRARKPPAGRWQCSGAQGAATLYGRAYRAATLTLWQPAFQRSRVAPFLFGGLMVDCWPAPL